MDRTPLDLQQCHHVWQRTREMVAYMSRLRSALASRGHDRRHTYYRMVDDAWRAAVAVQTASLICGGEYGFSVPLGTLATGDIPPVSHDVRNWLGDGI